MRTERRLSLLIWAMAATVVAALAGTAWSLVRGGHAEVLERSEQRASHLATSLQSGLNRRLQGLDLLLAGMNDIVRPAFRAPGDASSAGTAPPLEFDPEHGHRLLADMKARHLEFVHLALLQADGTVLASDRGSGPGLDFTLPAAWLTDALQAPAPRMTISDPRRSESSGELVLYAMRPVVLADGRRVVATAEVISARLTETLVSAAGASDSTVTLERRSGRLLASEPADTPLIGQTLAPALTLNQLDGRSMQMPGRLDGAAALVAARPMQYADMLLAVSLPLDPELAGWRRDRTRIAGVAAAFALLAVAAAGMARWQFGRLLQARRALAQSHATLNQALGAMADGFLLCDADDRVLRWNDRYVGMFPWLQPVLREGVPFRQLAEAAAPIAVPDGGASERAAWVEMRTRMHREANRAWEQDLGKGFVVAAVERRTSDGGVVSVVRDITADERRLRQATAAAEAANEAKSQFLANMSHEIRTPLNAVLGLNALMLGGRLTSEQRRHAELIGNAGQLLLALINDILDLSKIEVGGMQLAEQPFNPARAAQEVLALLRERATEKGLDLTLTLAPELPDCVLADPVRVRQVMFNLVGNALKFTDQGRVAVSLSQRAADNGDVLLVLTVQDTGIGIPADALPHLFDRFTQADTSAARRHGGSGLGLAIAKEVAHIMGGGIEVSSQPQVGSTFVATLRCRPAAPAAPLLGVVDPGFEATQSPARLTLAEPRRRLQVLVAEDNSVNQVLIQAILQRMGHWAEIAVDGLAAVRAVQREAHDLVLMDMQMPEMDGLDATRAIRRLPGLACRVPIVAMTANARPEDRQACLDAGMDDYVSKPIDLHDLARAIERAMGGRAMPTVDAAVKAAAAAAD